MLLNTLVFAIFVTTPFFSNGAPLNHTTVSLNNRDDTFVSLSERAVAVRIVTCKPNRHVKGRPSGRYLVAVKKGASTTDLFKLVSGTKGAVELKHVKMVMGKFDKPTLDKILQHKDVIKVAEDCPVKAAGTITQSNSPWGLARLSSKKKLDVSTPSKRQRLTYKYDSTAGACADIYVVDSGINIDHYDFGTPSRAIWGASFGGHGDHDDTGHGTHLAGVAGSTLFGVAKGARLIAVKVLGGVYPSFEAHVIQGLDWVIATAPSTGRPSIVNLSVVTGASDMYDTAVEYVLMHDIHVVTAAGNWNMDVQFVSPGRMPNIVTVGASTLDDKRVADSDWGALVDLFAPGENVMSTWIGSNTATNTLSGTSVASPHVAGLIAHEICRRPNTRFTPQTMQAHLIREAQLNRLDASTLPAGTHNRLAHVPST
ncbi:peptidase S8/S53 domain-containing protein [Panaeolus papilionaceus]|nr:peptidase S8/S53 domain-containing protein [Panaeolus papilionaceus]